MILQKVTKSQRLDLSNYAVIHFAYHMEKIKINYLLQLVMFSNDAKNISYWRENTKKPLRIFLFTVFLTENEAYLSFCRPNVHFIFNICIKCIVQDLFIINNRYEIIELTRAIATDLLNFLKFFYRTLLLIYFGFSSNILVQNVSCRRRKCW